MSTHWYWFQLGEKQDCFGIHSERAIATIVQIQEGTIRPLLRATTVCCQPQARALGFDSVQQLQVTSGRKAQSRVLDSNGSQIKKQSKETTDMDTALRKSIRMMPTPRSLSIIEQHYILFNHDAPCCCLAIMPMALLSHQAHGHDEPHHDIRNLKCKQYVKEGGRTESCEHALRC